MFPSACSLRSTQCAALIALATAAGISRFEPVTAADAAGSTAITQEQAAPGTKFQASYFQFALRALAPWFQVFHVDASDTRVADDSSVPQAPIGSVVSATASIDISLTASPLAPFAGQPICSFPSARHHNFPFAVGPPPYSITSPTRRAVSTFVLSDSTTRLVVIRSSVSRIASILSVFVARLARLEFAGAIAARPSFRSLALRGETSPRFSASSAAGTAFCLFGDSHTTTPI